jgi:hypothetical protein
LQNSIAQVSQTQQQAEVMAADFAAGNSTENLHEVMIALAEGQHLFPGDGPGAQQARLGLSRRDEHAGLTPLTLPAAWVLHSGGFAPTMAGMVVIPATRKRSGRGFDSRHLHHCGGALVSTG